ncbi:MAG: hypothetical protein BWK79_16420 [Beggiatoa sp. IS2]|nr:MAG: hypothetical protein BWK79_16420 [Beggiatoa sp. IS2]
MTSKKRVTEVITGNKKPEKPKSVPKSEEISSLVGYYQAEKLPAKKFLSLLNKNKTDTLQEQDTKQCLEQLGKNDPDFKRTLELLHQALSIQTKFGRQFVDFAFQACRQQLKVCCDLDLNLEQPANILFEQILQVLKPKLEAKKPDNLSLNLLKASGFWLNHAVNLGEFELIDLLAKEFALQKSEKPNQTSNAIDILLRPDTNLRTMIDTLTVADSGLSKAKSAKDSEIREQQRRQKEYERAQALQKRLDEAKNELSGKEQRIVELLSNLEQSKVEKESLEKKIQDIQTVNTHRKSELKGHCRVFLDKKISPLLEDALEATNLEPPRKNIITERLEMVKEEIKREIKWLSTD